jgi:hypothetical protein
MGQRDLSGLAALAEDAQDLVAAGVLQVGHLRLTRLADPKPEPSEQRDQGVRGVAVLSGGG